MAGDSQVPAVLVADGVLFGLLAVFLGLRLWVRFGILRSFEWDDGFVCFSSALVVGLLTSMMIMTNYGLGRHRDEVTDEQYLVFAKLNMVISCTYIWGFVTAKMSFAYLYLKVLPDRGYRIFNKVLLCFLVAQGIEETCVVLFQCKPIQRAWTPSLDGECLNLTFFYYAVFAVKLITDLVLFIEPIPVMWKLQLPLAKRIGLVSMLSLGLFVCIISIIRVTYVNFSSDDTTYSVTNSMIWSGVEVTALLICSCIPSLRPAIKTFPAINRALGLSSDHSSNRYYGKPNSGGVSIALTSRPKDKYLQSQRANSRHSRVRSTHFGITSSAAPKGVSSSAASTDEIFPHDVDKHGGILVTHEIGMAVEERRDISTADDSMSQASDDSVTRPKQARLSNKKGGDRSWLAGQ